MKITKVVLQDFSSYKGVHKFNFNNKFTLIGGHNGAGKSSLLNAIKWCLFNKKLFDSEHATNEYNQFVINNINWEANSMCVKLYIEHENNDYLIIRSAENIDKLEVKSMYYKNGNCEKHLSLLDTFDSNLIESFFFDGETILKYIDDNNIHTYIKYLTYVCFNLLEFDVLRNDLDRLKNMEYNAAKNNNYDRIKREYMASKEVVNSLTKSIKDYRIKLDKVTITIDELEVNMKNLHVLDDNKYCDLQNQNEQLKNKLRKQETKKKQFLINDSSSLLLHETLNEIANKLNENRKLRLEMLKKIYTDFSNNLEVKYDLIDLSLEQKIMRKYHITSSYDTNDINGVLKNISKLQKEELEVRKLLKESDEGKVYIANIDDYDSYVEEKTQLVYDIKNLEKGLEIEQGKLNKLGEKLDEAEKEVSKDIQLKNAINERIKLESIIDEYISYETKNIANNISKELINTYQLIAHKENLISEIEYIDNVLYVKKEGKLIDINKISSGEKQILIVSIIFTIIKLANINIPLVLDTFLGRIDVAHSKNLLRFLNDNLNNQIILLATMKEISKKEYKQIKKYNVGEYRLENNGDDTVVWEGFYSYED